MLRCVHAVRAAGGAEAGVLPGVAECRLGTLWLVGWTHPSPSSTCFFFFLSCPCRSCRSGRRGLDAARLRRRGGRGRPLPGGGPCARAHQPARPRPTAGCCPAGRTAAAPVPWRPPRPWPQAAAASRRPPRPRPSAYRAGEAPAARRRRGRGGDRSRSSNVVLGAPSAAHIVLYCPSTSMYLTPFLSCLC